MMPGAMVAWARTRRGIVDVGSWQAGVGRGGRQYADQSSLDLELKKVMLMKSVGQYEHPMS